MKNKKMLIYLDNASTTKIAPDVVRELKTILLSQYGNPSSIHSFGREAKQLIENARVKIAEKISALPEQIIFTSGGTESNNIAIRGVAYKLKNKGNHIITSKIEHPSVLDTCQALEKEGFSATYLTVDSAGLISLKELENSINKNTILVTIQHGNNEIGTLQDIEKIGSICKKHNVLFHTDAVQSFMKSRINTKTMNIDLMSLSAHKIHGPKGIGALFVKNKNQLEKINTGGHQEFDLRPGTEDVPSITGFAKSTEVLTEKDITNMNRLRDYFTKELLKIPHTKLNGSKQNRLCNSISISFNYIEGESLLLSLDKDGIAVSTGSACTSQTLEPSHVLLAIGLPPQVAHGTIRISLSKYTTKKEADYCIKKINKAVNTLRMMSPLAH